MPHEQEGRPEASAEEDHEVECEAISVLDLERQILKKEKVSVSKRLHFLWPFSISISPRPGVRLRDRCGGRSTSRTGA